jgi:hypothetical protein
MANPAARKVVSATLPARSKRKGAEPRLVDLDLSAFPFREVVEVDRLTVEETAVLVRGALADQGFVLGVGDVPGYSPPVGQHGPAAPVLLLGERNLRTDVTDISTLTTLFIVLLGGGVLGVLDSVVTRSVLAIPLWLAGFGAFALILWAAFGRVYQSDVIVALIRVRRSSVTAADSVTGRVEVVWFAGKVRSDRRGTSGPGTRRATRVQVGYGVVSSLAGTIRSFRGQSAPSAGA